MILKASRLAFESTETLDVRYSSSSADCFCRSSCLLRLSRCLESCLAFVGFHRIYLGLHWINFTAKRGALLEHLNCSIDMALIGQA